jgi:multicomponent Na+:H+ antiporter subunit D
MDEIVRATPFAALSLVLPLAGALAAFLLGRRAPFVLAVVIPGSLWAAGMLVAEVWTGGAAVYPVGGWIAPLGIALQVDGLSAAFVLTTAVVTSAVALFALPTFAAARETRAGFAFWPLVLILWAALNAVFLGRDLFNLYVALELLTLAAVALVALDGKAETIAAALRYLLFALLGSLGYLLGAVLLYAAYGTLDMGLLRESAGRGPTVLVAGGLMTAGLLAKTALFPLHAWLPPAHGGAPPPASALLSALVVKASFYILVRLWFDVLPVAATAEMAQILAAFGAGAILFGSLLALRQQRLKLIVAYSTVAQLGYLFLMFPLAGGYDAQQPWTAGAWSGGIFHALSHAAAKAAMFLSAGVLIHAVGHDRLDGMAGLARALPMTAFAFGLSALSLMGLPPSGGFIAKYLLLTSSLASGQWWWAVVMLAGGLLAAGYLFRPLNRLLAEVPEVTIRHEVGRGRQALCLLLAAVSVALGVFSYAPFRLIQIGRPGAAVEGL